MYITYITGGNTSLSPRLLLLSACPLLRRFSFSTENLDNKEHEDRLSKFAEFLHYFKELTFDFTSFHVSPDAIRVKDIYAKKEGTVVSATTEDL